VGTQGAHTMGRRVMTHKYRGSQQSSREVKPKFIDSTQGEPKNIYKPIDELSIQLQLEIDFLVVVYQ
jgi:hypothetical protein